jgi:hypothetical protein
MFARRMRRTPEADNGSRDTRMCFVASTPGLHPSSEYSWPFESPLLFVLFGHLLSQANGARQCLSTVIEACFVNFGAQ